MDETKGVDLRSKEMPKPFLSADLFHDVLDLLGLILRADQCRAGSVDHDEIVAANDRNQMTFGRNDKIPTTFENNGITANGVSGIIK